MYYGNISTTSNRADWTEVVVMTDDDTGDLIDIHLCRITLTVRRTQRNPNFYGDSYPYDDFGSVLTGSTDTGEITFPGGGTDGTFQWSFPYTRMSCLKQGEYAVGIRISQGGVTMQLIIGTVTVLEGIDMQ